MKIQEIVNYAVANNLGKKENNNYSIKLVCSQKEFDTFNNEIDKVTTQYLPNRKKEELPFTRFRSLYGVSVQLELNNSIKGYIIDAN